MLERWAVDRLFIERQTLLATFALIIKTLRFNEENGLGINLIER